MVFFSNNGYFGFPNFSNSHQHKYFIVTSCFSSFLVLGYLMAKSDLDFSNVSKAF